MGTSWKVQKLVSLIKIQIFWSLLILQFFCKLYRILIVYSFRLYCDILCKFIALGNVQKIFLTQLASSTSLLQVTTLATRSNSHGSAVIPQNWHVTVVQRNQPVTSQGAMPPSLPKLFDGSKN